MPFLTSEQYRDVLKYVPGCTEEIPTVQQLLRRGVETFFKRFGAYPEVGGVAPGKVGIFGEQTQFDDGMALPTATPMATIVVGKRAPGKMFTVVTSADVGKPHKIKFSFSRHRPLAPECPEWLNHVKGVIDNFENDEVPPFDAAIESSIPMGVGFGSSAAIEVATYSFIEMLIGKKTDPVEKAKACQRAEAFAGKEVGLVDRISSILAKDRHAMVFDCKTNNVQWVPFQNPEIVFIAVDPHVEDKLLGEEYPERSKYIKKACEILGVQSLRDCTEEDLNRLEVKVAEILGEIKEDTEEEENDIDKPKESEIEELDEEEKKNFEGMNIWSKEEYDIMIKRTRFFITEMKRIEEALNAWNDGDVKSFGEKMKESHRSLKEDFDFSNPLLEFLVETSLQIEGVLGSRMTGMGLGYGGAIVSIMNKENVEKYCNYLMQKFTEFEDQLAKELKESRMKEKQKQHEIKKIMHSENFNPSIASSDKIEQIQEFLESGGKMRKMSLKRSSVEEQKICSEKKRTPCLLKVEKRGGCGTWARYEKEKDKEEFFRKKFLEEEKEKKKLAEEKKGEKEGRSASLEPSAASNVSDVSSVQLRNPTFYMISPFAGARMIFVTKNDILRSLYAQYLPHPYTLVRSGLEIFKSNYGTKPEAVGLAPATVTLFGEFMEFHLGYIICMALPMFTVTVGGRNDTVCFSVETMSKDVEEPYVMKCPVPCVRSVEMDSRPWVNFVLGTVNEFKGHVPGFNAVINSSIPVKVGVNSCAAFQASVYTFLENLTSTFTEDPFEKADRCGKSEYKFRPTTNELVTRCSIIKFFPTFLCRDGHLMFINCRRYKISHYFFDHPSYVFLVGSCKENTTKVTIESLEERLKQCMQALEILGKNSLLTVDLKHLRCLKKRHASEEAIKRVKYVITEHHRTIEAVKAIKDEDYARVGVLMNESHASLRDDYEVSSPEIEALVKLARNVEGVLGVKMLGKGLNAAVVILVQISRADNCIRYMRKNYKAKNDKPVFYMTKPSRGAFAINPKEEDQLLVPQP